MWKRVRSTVKAAFLAVFAVGICWIHVYAQQPVEFHWTDSRQDKALWSKVRQALQHELNPDIHDPNAQEYAYRYLKRVGVINHSVLAFVAYKISEHPTRSEADGEYISAFNCDPVSGVVAVVENPEDHNPLKMWQWKFSTQVQLEPSPAPDLLFTYLSCWECEPETILSALHYVAEQRQWQVRSWGNGKTQWWMTAVGLVVAIDIYGGDDTVSYDCLYGVLDTDRHVLKSLAIRCKEVHEPAKGKFKVNDATALYSYKDGYFTSEIIASKEQRLHIWVQLCTTAGKKSLCKAP